MTDMSSRLAPMRTSVRLHDYRRRHRRIFFSRPELNQLLSLYSRQVVRGEWRDYAIDQHDGAALFSVFRHTHESPLYTIVKTAPGTAPARRLCRAAGPPAPRQRRVAGRGHADPAAVRWGRSRSRSTARAAI